MRLFDRIDQMTGSPVASVSAAQIAATGPLLAIDRFHRLDRLLTGERR